MHGLSFYIYLVYHANFFFKDKTILHLAICTCRNLINLDYLKENKVSVNSIHDLDDFFPTKVNDYV